MNPAGLAVKERNAGSHCPCVGKTVASLQHCNILERQSHDIAKVVGELMSVGNGRHCACFRYGNGRQSELPI